MRTYYVGMDVHSATIAIAVLNGAGKVVMELTIKTGTELVRGFLKQLHGRVYVAFEEGTQATRGGTDLMGARLGCIASWMYVKRHQQPKSAIQNATVIYFLRPTTPPTE